jgi:hypothetical protein
MLGPERLLGDYELATIKGLCLGIASFEPAQLAQIVEHGRNRVAFGTELFFEDLQSTQQIGLHIPQTSLGFVELSEVIERHGHVHVVRAQGFLEDC